MQSTYPKDRPEISLILNFLDEIKIDYTIESGVKGSFSKHVEIDQGKLKLDYEKVGVGSLLHEAGHLALIFSPYRELFHGNLFESFKKYFSLLDNLPFDDLRTKILMGCNDEEVTAWSWAVGVHLGLEPKKVIEDLSYGGQGEFIRDLLSISSRSTMPYIGVAKLHYATYTEKFNNRTNSKSPEDITYPKMKYWTADEALKANGLDMSCLENKNALR